MKAQSIEEAGSLEAAVATIYAVRHLRLRLVKLAARVVELKTQVKIHLPSSAPDQAIFAMLLDRLVLGLTTRAVEPLVEVLGAAAFQAGDDEPGIGAFEPGLDAGDDALDPAPALRGILELPEAPHLAAPRRRLEARGGALLQCRDMTAKCGVGGQAEDPIHPVFPAPVEHFRGRMMAVGAQQDLDLWPMAAQGADQAAHKAADLHPARPLAGP